MSLPHPIIIAGPCAVESEEQMEIAIREGKKRSVTFLRTNLWKPRTKPGFDGLGEKGFPILQKVAQAGLNPGLEVITPEQAQQVLDVVLPHLGTDGQSAAVDRRTQPKSPGAARNCQNCRQRPARIHDGEKPAMD